MEKVEVERTDAANLCILAGGLSFVAGVLHIVAAVPNLERWWGYAFFFMTAALAQITAGLVLMIQPWAFDDTGGARIEGDGWLRPFCQLGIASNAFLILVWLITRTVGIPFFGPQAGMVLPVTPLSVAVQVVEVALIATLVVLLRGSLAGEKGTARAPAHRG